MNDPRLFSFWQDYAEACLGGLEKGRKIKLVYLCEGGSALLEENKA